MSGLNACFVQIFNVLFELGAKIWTITRSGNFFGSQEDAREA
jgi:hypothetical protein